MNTVDLNGASGKKFGSSFKPTFVTGQKYYIIDETCMAKLRVIVEEELKLAAQTACDPNANERVKTLAHQFAQDMIDLQGQLIYAECGIARRENEWCNFY